MKKLSNFLDDVLPKQHSWKITLLQNWESIVGDLKDKVRVEKITDNSLIIGVSHPAWAQQLYMLSGVLKKKINVVLKEERIKSLHFKTVVLGKNKGSKENEVVAGERSFDSSLTVLSKKEQSYLEKIKDEELKNILFKYYARCVAIRPKKNRRRMKNEAKEYT